jgi:hypothetical protein
MRARWRPVTTRIRARRFVIATGAAVRSRHSGAGGGRYLTNETIFACPASAASGSPFSAAGRSACENSAQAHRRLGSEVTLIEAGRILAGRGQRGGHALIRAAGREGITLIEGRAWPMSSRRGGRTADAEPATRRLAVRRPAAGGDREAARVSPASGWRPPASRHDGAASRSTRPLPHQQPPGLCHRRLRRRAAVHPCRRPSGRAGDPQRPVPAAGAGSTPTLVPRVTYTDPEIAVVGLSEAEARAPARARADLRWPFSENDRARIDGATEGFVKADARPQGAHSRRTIVGATAGDLIAPWTLAMRQKLKIGAMIDLRPALSDPARRPRAAPRCKA